MSRLIWIYAVYKSLLLSPVAVKELIRVTTEGTIISLTNIQFYGFKLKHPTHEDVKTILYQIGPA